MTRPLLRFLLVICSILASLVPHTCGWSLRNNPRPSSAHLTNRKEALSTILVTFFAPGTINIASAANEEGEVELSEEELQKRREELRQRLIERRKLMEASRSSNNRQSYLDLSRQRAALYNTTYQGVTCPPNIPCI